jgi:hypothetical protein
VSSALYWEKSHPATSCADAIPAQPAVKTTIAPILVRLDIMLDSLLV